LSTVQETLEEITRLQHRRGILADVADYLAKNYLGDGSEVLVVSDCARPEVPQDAINEVIGEMISQMDELEETIEERKERPVK